MSELERRGGNGSGLATTGAAAPAESGNLGDILERVLDKGIVIAGDIRINLLEIELLTIKLRLVVASVDTARRMGINWWETDPWMSGRDLQQENRTLQERVERLERQLEHASSGDRELPAAESGDDNAALRERLERLERELDRSTAEQGSDD